MDRRTEIERLAHELYGKSDRRGGRELNNWVEAERLIESCVAEMKETQERTVGRKAAGCDAAMTPDKISQN